MGRANRLSGAVRHPRWLLALLLVCLVAPLTLTAWSPAGAAAAVPCGLFGRQVQDRINPQTQVQLLTDEDAEADRYSRRGFTLDRGTSMSVSGISGPGLSAVHRLFRRSKGDLLYSADPAELARAVSVYGYVDEGISFYASRTPAACLTPVYSFLRLRMHRFTALAGERAVLRDSGWRPEGIRFYVGRPVDGAAFGLAVLPDTQMEVGPGDPRFLDRSRWLVRRAQGLRLRFVTHTGDVVNWDTPTHDQYLRAAAALEPLDGRIPYSLSPGNHDTAAVCPGGAACDAHRTRALVRDTSSFNTYLDHGTADVRGRFEPDKVDNTYSTFSAGGAQFLVLNLELWPRRSVVAWAQQVVATHPWDNVVVATHSYLTADGAIYDQSDYGDSSPQYLYDHLIKVYPNIRVVLSGHTGRSAQRTDVGEHGNRIVSLLLTMHDVRTNPLRLIEINPVAGSLDTWVFAPETDRLYPSFSRSYAGMQWIRS